jgi:hypothetical protein
LIEDDANYYSLENFVVVGAVKLKSNVNQSACQHGWNPQWVESANCSAFFRRIQTAWIDLHKYFIWDKMFYIRGSSPNWLVDDQDSRGPGVKGSSETTNHYKSLNEG